MSTLPRIPRKSSLPWHLLLTPDTSSDTLADTTDMVWQFHPYDISNSRCLSPVIKCTHVNLSLILALNHLHEEYEVDEFTVSIFISLEAEGYKMALLRIVSPFIPNKEWQSMVKSDRDLSTQACIFTVSPRCVLYDYWYSYQSKAYKTGICTFTQTLN